MEFPTWPQMGLPKNTFQFQAIVQSYNYIITGSRSLRANSDYTLSLTVYDEKSETNEPIVVRVSIVDDRDEFTLNRDVTINSNDTVFVAIPVGDLLSDRSYKLIAKGISGTNLYGQANLDVQPEKYAILIQTDKVIYKPNDRVKFRVLVLDSELKGVTLDKNELCIMFQDPCRNLMRKWKGVNTVSGVFSDEFQLSDLPILGKWDISASIGNEQTKTAIIEVDKYVLPTFEVTIDSPEHFSLTNQNVKLVVRARYTHGKPLKGMVCVSITEVQSQSQSPFQSSLFGMPMQPPNPLPLGNIGGFTFGSAQMQQLNSNIYAFIPITKKFEITGQKTVEFDISNDLKCNADTLVKSKSFKIEATVTETLTGLEQKAEQTIQVHKDTYEISTNLHEFKHNIKRGKTINAKIFVRQRDGSLVTALNDRKIKIVIEQVFQSPASKCLTEKEFELNENCDVHLPLKIAENENYFMLKVKFADQATDLGPFYPNIYSYSQNIDLKVEISNETCFINKEIEVKVTSEHRLQFLTYLIVARGKICESKTITPVFNHSNGIENMYKFSVLPTFEYAPKMKIIVFYVKDRTIVSATVTAKLLTEFKNFIELDVSPNTANPSDRVDIYVKSNPKSFIGLLGVDKSTTILRSGNDLIEDKVWEEFEKILQPKVKPSFYSREITKMCWQDFVSENLVILSNTIDPPQPACTGFSFATSGATLFGASSGMATFGQTANSLSSVVPLFGAAPCSNQTSFPSSLMASPVIPKIRKNFPETWIWESINNPNFNGLLRLNRKVPDSLTTWVLTGFSIDPINGFALTKAPSELCVQQKFHISLNLPYSVKRGEIITIPCSIFNYMPCKIEAEIVFENEHNDFEFVDSPKGVEFDCEVAKQKSRKKTLIIAPEDALNVSFTIRPTKVGPIPLKVSALSSIASDCVVKTLNVECEGVTQFVNKAIFVDLRNSSQFEPVNVPIEIPENALPDSTRIEITCVGDLLGGTIQNLEKLIRLPFGCGEQNMLNFVPNIVILNYLTNTQQLTDEIEAKAKRFMITGYQRELDYKHKDGSFSAFGESDKSGSTWLTAFVARSFRQATDHIHIESNIIEDALKWLSNVQAADGSFPEKGSICHKEMQGGSSNGVALTAYVLTAFLVNKNTNNAYEETIEKAINNIVRSLENCSDSYALAVSAYALQLANHASKSDALSRLKQLAQSNGNHVWWEKTKINDTFMRCSKTLNVEITAYVLLTMILNGNDSECLPVFRWLLNQRNDLGGFEGTQDTIVGIEALANFAAKISTTTNNVKIDVATSSNKYIFDVNQDNALVLQSQKVMPDAKSVRVNAVGVGFALIEVGYRYNINTTEAMPSFSLFGSTKLLSQDHLGIELTTSYQPKDGASGESNMVVLETALPSGFVVKLELLNKLKLVVPLIKRVETKNSDTVAVIYFDHLTSSPVTLQVDCFREHLVSEQKPSSIVIYDYYDNALSAREFYTI